MTHWDASSESILTSIFNKWRVACELVQAGKSHAVHMEHPSLTSCYIPTIPVSNLTTPQMPPLAALLGTTAQLHVNSNI